MGYINSLFNGIDFSTFGMPNIGLNTIVDILAVTFISYNMLIWIKETRAWSLFKGIVVVFLITILSDLFNLYTISYIISSVFLYGILAIVVIFQPEMRKALEQLGKGKFMKIISIGNEVESIGDHTISEMIVAVEKMAKVKTGALIVVEEQVALGDLESTGIKIDALVSSQLLINIFENKTPLHDGAVIIRNNRIAAATCILPLTQANISADLGTRHRAAIGASEVSDALILVVSEETGQLSVARGGKLYRNCKPEGIKKMLEHNPVKPKRKMSLWKGAKK